MRLVFVHGMRQEGHEPETLRAEWMAALEAGWTAAGLEALSVAPEMPFYGDELDRLTRELTASSGLLLRGGAQEPSATEAAMLREFASANGVGETEIRAELGSQLVARGPANWEWVQATVRALESKLPSFRALGVRLVQQVDAYLNRPHVTQAIDAIVGVALHGEPAVVVAHSLGTIVAYRLLRTAPASRFRAPLLVTLGSPLGIQAVRDRIRPPKLSVPDGVGHWLNGADERDYVALYAALDGSCFADGIENIVDIHNGRADPHAICDYLKDVRIARAIHGALTTAGSHTG